MAACLCRMTHGLRHLCYLHKRGLKRLPHIPRLTQPPHMRPEVRACVSHRTRWGCTRLPRVCIALPPACTARSRPALRQRRWGKAKQKQNQNQNQNREQSTAGAYPSWARSARLSSRSRRAASRSANARRCASLSLSACRCALAACAVSVRACVSLSLLSSVAPCTRTRACACKHNRLPTHAHACAQVLKAYQYTHTHMHMHMQVCVVCMRVCLCLLVSAHLHLKLIYTFHERSLPRRRDAHTLLRFPPLRRLLPLAISPRRRRERYWHVLLRSCTVCVRERKRERECVCVCLRAPQVGDGHTNQSTIHAYAQASMHASMHTRTEPHLDAVDEGDVCDAASALRVLERVERFFE